MAIGTSASSIAMPCNCEGRTRKSATGSPPASRACKISISPPIARKISTTAARVGFMPTFSNSNAPSRAISAATIKKAAEDTSPGTTTSQAVSRCPPRMMSVAPSLPISTPKPRNIRSL